MKKGTLEVFIQSVEGRPIWEKMRVLLEASDVGKDYTRLSQQAGTQWKEHFLSVLDAMKDSTSEFVVRFEDDCVGVNKHIRHNLLSWPALSDPNLGSGWGYHPGNIPRSDDIWHYGALPGSLCTLFRTEDMPRIIDFCMKSNQPQDIAMSQAVASIRKRICIHGPSLVQHEIGVKSAMGNVHGSGATSRCYDENWKR